VPKHGYRFIAPLHGGIAKSARPVSDHDWSTFMRLGIMGTAGAGVAGIIGGLFYGFLGANGPELGGISVLLVLLVLTTVLAVIGGAGVSFGIATIALTRSQPWYWPILGGAIGGTLVGAVVRLLGVDALHLLFGNSPGNMTGALEGTMLGAATGLGFIIASRREKLRIGAPLAALCGAFAGFAIFRLGWHLMGGSLNQLVEHFPGAQLVLPGLFGEDRLGPASEMVTAALEGFLFSGCVVCAMLLAKRNAKA
jgi:hypothetical protein